MENEIREQLSWYGKKIIEKGLAAGPGGNISAKDEDFVYLSPSGFALDEIGHQQWVKLNIKTGNVEGLKPTCEVSMHLGCYLARKEIKAVIHTHPPLTLALICAGREFKAFCPDFVALLGKKVPVIPYVIPSGEEIRKAVVEQIKKYNVVLLKNHGVVCVGESLKEAFSRSWLIEESARTILYGTLLGKFRYLNKKEIDDIDHLPAEDFRRTLLKSAKK
ncbi:MAG: class II aldolase/adducin family protein [Candidatus Omnitrophica bacterium]|nr:class II aldolase/adducin family protein [Candidatus Omnitrophota bacterium]